MTKKNFIWNLIGSTANSFSSLFFMIIVTRINGLKEAGVFTFAFSFAILVQVIGSYSGRSYQVTNLDNKITDNDFFYSRIITCLAMLIFSLLFIIVKKYNCFKFKIIMFLVIVKMIESFSDFLHGYIQKKGNLYQVGISLTLKSTLSVIIFLIIDIITKKLIISTFSILLVNIIVTFLYDRKKAIENGLKLSKIDKKNVKTILYKGFFVFLFTIFMQYIFNASKYSIDSYLKDELQTIFGIIIMPATVMALCAQFIIQPFLTDLTSLLENKKIKEFIKLVIKICAYLLVIGILALLMAYLLGIPVLNIIFNIKLEKYKNCLLLIILGAILYGIITILSTVLIALRKIKIQAIMIMFFSIITYFLSNYMVKTYELLGASLSYLVSMFIIFIGYVICFRYYSKKIKEENNL